MDNMIEQRINIPRKESGAVADNETIHFTIMWRNISFKKGTLVPRVNYLYNSQVLLPTVDRVVLLIEMICGEPEATPD